MLRAVVALLAVSALPGAVAATAPQASALVSIEALPVVHVREGRVHGCGVRLTAGEARVPVSSWFDVSVNLFRRGIALAQSIAYEIHRSEREGDSRPVTAAVESTWVRAREGPVRRGENLERMDSLVYTILEDDVLAVFEAVARGDVVTLGIKRWGEATDAVYSGRAVLADSSRARIGACLAALSDDQQHDTLSARQP